MYWRLCYNRYYDNISSSLYIRIKKKYPHSDTDVSRIILQLKGSDQTGDRKCKISIVARWPVASHYHVNIYISWIVSMTSIRACFKFIYYRHIFYVSAWYSRFIYLIVSSWHRHTGPIIVIVSYNLLPMLKIILGAYTIQYVRVNGLGGMWNKRININLATLTLYNIFNNISTVESRKSGLDGTGLNI